MKALVGNWAPEWGHTWLSRGFGKVYALRSLADGSALCIFDESSLCSIGEFPTAGKHSCHITLLGKQAVVSDYTSGTLSFFSLDSCGVPDEAPALVRFRDKSHIHSSWLSPEGNKLVVVDLGADVLYSYPVIDGKVQVDRTEEFVLPEGCGPRHCAFGKGVLYIATELSDEILVLEWPSMALKQRVIVNSLLPHGGAHVLLSPDGRFLYVSSRLKNDGIGVYRVMSGGLLGLVDYVRTGAHPRHFCVSRDGAYLAVACRDDDVVQLFSRSNSEGTLELISESKSVPKPVYVELV